MKTIVIIINGINLPYHVIDHAIGKAKKNSSEIFALFLKRKREPSKGYGYPSDLATTETCTSDDAAVMEDEKIISQNMKIVQNMVEIEKIPYQSTLKTNTLIDEVIEITAMADLIVAACKQMQAVLFMNVSMPSKLIFQPSKSFSE